MSDTKTKSTSKNETEKLQGSGGPETALDHLVDPLETQSSGGNKQEERTGGTPNLGAMLLGASQGSGQSERLV